MNRKERRAAKARGRKRCNEPQTYSFSDALKTWFPPEAFMPGGKLPAALNSKGEEGPCKGCGSWVCHCGATDVPDAYLSPYGGTHCSHCGKEPCRTVLETSWGPGSLELCWQCWLAGPVSFREKYRRETV